jgi:hypothetical protein
MKHTFIVELAEQSGNSVRWNMSEPREELPIGNMWG